LSADAKRELASKRLKWGHKPGARDSWIIKGTKTKDSKAKDSNTEVIKNLKAVKRSVAQLTKQKAADNKSSGLFTKTDSEASPNKKVTLVVRLRTDPIRPLHVRQRRPASDSSANAVPCRSYKRLAQSTMMSFKPDGPQFARRPMRNRF
jgi:molecular chaperone DnaK (HSP70)